MDDDDDEQRRVQVPVPQTYKAVNSLLHDLHAEHQHRLLWSSSTTGTSTPFAPSPTYVPSSASAVGMAQHHIAQAAHAHLPRPSLPSGASPRSKEMVNVQLPVPLTPNTQREDAAMQYEDSNRCGLSICPVSVHLADYRQASARGVPEPQTTTVGVIGAVVPVQASEYTSSLW